jgi:hypothetical protein
MVDPNHGSIKEAIVREKNKFKVFLAFAIAMTFGCS